MAAEAPAPLDAPAPANANLPGWYVGPGIYTIDDWTYPGDHPSPFNRKAAVYRDYDRLNIVLREFAGDLCPQGLVTRATKTDETPSEFILDLGDRADRTRKYLMLSTWPMIIDALYDTFPEDQPKMNAMRTWMNRDGHDQVRIFNRIVECRDLVVLQTDPSKANYRAMAGHRRSIDQQHQWDLDKMALPPRMHAEYDRYITQTRFTKR